MWSSKSSVDLCKSASPMMPRQFIFSFILFSCIFVFGSTQNVVTCADCFADYWRIVPKNAFVAGRDPVGNPFYLGLAHLYQIGRSTTCIIFPGLESIYVADFDLFLKINKAIHVKILTSNHKRHFRWVKADINKLHSLTNHTLVSALELSGQQLFFGRVPYNNNNVVATIFPKYFDFHGVYISSRFQQMQYSTFEILTLNIKKHRKKKHIKSESLTDEEIDKILFDI